MLEYLDIAIGFATVMLLLSLVVTAIVQVISTLLDLRGNNLVWALANLFDQVQLPAMRSKASDGNGPPRKQTVAMELATAVAQDSSIAPSTMLSWYKAKNIRASELQAIVHKLAASPPEGMSKEARTALQQLVSERIPGAGATLNQANEITTELEQLFPARAQIVRCTVERALGKTERLSATIETWFQTIMDRSADRFARNSKICAAAVGVAVAFLFQLNAISIFLQISRNGGVRSQLVALAQPMLQQASQIQNQNTPAGITLSSMKGEDTYRTQLQSAPDNVATCAEGKGWITTHLQNSSPVAAEFERRCTQQQVTASIAEFSKATTMLSDTLDRTQLRISGTPKGWKWYEQAGGCLSTAILLALGGPFWFNLLRQMVSLRPPTAQKIAEEPTPSTLANGTMVGSAAAGK